MSRPLIVANWKMHKQAAEGSLLARGIAERAASDSLSCDIVLCPPATLLHVLSPILDQTPIALGGQDCHSSSQGPHTGDIAAAMLVDAGASYVILGHSERRAEHGESNALVRTKAAAALAVGLTPIICVGETAEERQAGQAEDVVTDQLRCSLSSDSIPIGCVVAYEPLWAIGSGQIPDAGEIRHIHATIGHVLSKMDVSIPGHSDQADQDKTGQEHCHRHDQKKENRAVPVLYGGSVKPDNASEILAIDGVDGLLVGGASLQLDSFWSIVMATAPDSRSEPV